MIASNGCHQYTGFSSRTDWMNILVNTAWSKRRKFPLTYIVRARSEFSNLSNTDQTYWVPHRGSTSRGWSQARTHYDTVSRLNTDRLVWSIHSVYRRQDWNSYGFLLPVHTGGEIDTHISHCCMVDAPPPPPIVGWAPPPNCLADNPLSIIGW